MSILFKYRVLLYCLFVFFASLVVFIISLPPSITFGDSGEFVTAAYFWGIPHPPGSPFWTFIAHFFTLLPINSVAWRVNFSSAFFASLTITVLAIYIHWIYKPKKQSVAFFSLLSISVLIFAYSKSFWSQAVIAKYFTFNSLLFGLLLLSVYKFIEVKKTRYFCLFFLLAGLNIATHYLIFLLLPILSLWIIMFHWHFVWTKHLLPIGMLFFFLGLSAFLYLPIRARTNPPINWGNPQTISAFFNHVTRKQFQRDFISESANLGVAIPIASFSQGKFISRIYTSAIAFGITVYYEFTPFALPFCFLGIFYLTRQRETKKWFYFTFLLFVSGGWGFAFLTNAPISLSPFTHAEYLYAYMIVTIWIGCGVAFLYENFRVKFQSKFIYLLVPITALIPLYLLKNNFQANNLSHNTVAYDHAINILQTVDQNAILIADKNNWIFPLLYVSTVEHFRPDITIYDRTGNLFEKVYNFTSDKVKSEDQLEKSRDETEKKIRDLYPNRSFYYAADKNFENYSREVNQEGILYKDIRFLQKIIDFPKKYSNILRIKDLPSHDYDTEYMIAYYHFRYADLLLENKKVDAAKTELQKALQIGNDNTLVLTNTAKYFGELNDIDEAIKIYEKLVSKNSANDTVYFNLGVLFEKKGKNKDAIHAYQKAIEKNRKHLQAIFQLAHLFEEEKQYKEMLEQYMNLENMNYETQYTVEKILYAAVHIQECQVAEIFYPKLDVTANFKVIANNIGICHAQKKEFDKAKNWWEKALELDKNYAEPKENLKRLQSFPHSL